MVRWLEKGWLGEGSFQKWIGWLGKDSVLNFKQRAEGRERVNQAGAEWGLFKAESKGPTGELICQWNGKGGSVTDVQLKSGVVTAIHSIQGMVRTLLPKTAINSHCRGLNRGWTQSDSFCSTDDYGLGEGQGKKQENMFRDYDSHISERWMDSDQV